MNFDFHSAFTDIAHGDENARQFLIVSFEFIHLMDDLLDKDKTRTPIEFATIVSSFIEVVGANPFFQAHRQALFAAFRSGLIAWAASEDWKGREGVVDRLASEVLKSHYQEMFYLVASLTGGMPHALAMSKKYRGYDVG